MTSAVSFSDTNGKRIYDYTVATCNCQLGLRPAIETLDVECSFYFNIQYGIKLNVHVIANRQSINRSQTMIFLFNIGGNLDKFYFNMTRHFNYEFTCRTHKTCLKMWMWMNESRLNLLFVASQLVVLLKSPFAAFALLKGDLVVHSIYPWCQGWDRILILFIISFALDRSFPEDGEL